MLKKLEHVQRKVTKEIEVRKWERMGSIGKELVIIKEEVNISFDQKLVSRTKWNLQRETL